MDPPLDDMSFVSIFGIWALSAYASGESFIAISISSDPLSAAMVTEEGKRSSDLVRDA